MSTLSTSRSQVQKTQERKSAQEKLKQFLRNYPFCFALAASVLMLAINLVMQPSFNATIQLASFAPLALAAIATAPSMLSGGIDLSISPQWCLLLSFLSDISFLQGWTVSSRYRY